MGGPDGTPPVASAHRFPRYTLSEGAPMSEIPPPSPPSSRSSPSWQERLDLIAQRTGWSRAQIVAFAGSVIAIAGCGWLLLRPPPGPPAEAVLARVRPAVTSTTAPETVVVHAAGAVLRPGVYVLPAGARVNDLLAAAGGSTAEADLNRLNLAAALVDGSQVFVPRAGEAVPAGAGDGGAAPGGPSGPVNLNTATLEQLDALPGVGPATAKAILDERERRGRFRSVEELLEVRGIGPAKLDALRDLVVV
jgi:competence protein ComEA